MYQDYFVNHLFPPTLITISITNSWTQLKLIGWKEKRAIFIRSFNKSTWYFHPEDPSYKSDGPRVLIHYFPFPFPFDTHHREGSIERKNGLQSFGKVEMELLSKVTVSREEPTSRIVRIKQGI